MWLQELNISAIRRMCDQLRIVTIILAIVGSVPVLADRKQVACIWVESAKIALNNDLNDGQFGHANYGHQIEAGSFSVLSIRVLEDDERGVDSELFSKTTLEIDHVPQDIPVGQGTEVKVLRSYYTKGSAGFIPKGQYFWANDALHEIRLKRDIDGYGLTVNADVQATNAKNGRTQIFHLGFDCQLNKRPLSDLGPWEGKVGTNWNSFAPNRP